MIFLISWIYEFVELLVDQVTIEAIFSLIVRINNKRKNMRKSVTVDVNISINVLQKAQLYFHNGDAYKYIWKKKKQETFPWSCLTWWMGWISERCITFTAQNISSVTTVIAM